MARSSKSHSTYAVRRTTFRWPQAQFHFWILFVLITGSVLIGIFAQFLTTQSQMGLGVPWLFPYGVTVGSLTILAVILLLIFLNKGNLTPGMLMIVSFVLLVLYITGIVDTGIQLWGEGHVASTCNTYVNGNQQTGATLYTLAWMQQNNICNCWYTVFAFWILGSVVFVFLFILATKVNAVYE